MSEIRGDGYGSSHNWQRGYTGPGRFTPYHCSACGAGFNHHYNAIPNIFEAIQHAGVQDQCVGAMQAYRSQDESPQSEHSIAAFDGPTQSPFVQQSEPAFIGGGGESGGGGASASWDSGSSSSPSSGYESGSSSSDSGSSSSSD